MSAYPLAIEIPLAVGVPVVAPEHVDGIVVARMHDGGMLWGLLHGVTFITDDSAIWRVDLSTHLGFAHALRWYATRSPGVAPHEADSFIDTWAWALARDRLTRADVLALDAAIAWLGAAYTKAGI